MGLFPSVYEYITLEILRITHCCTVLSPLSKYLECLYASISPNLNNKYPEEFEMCHRIGFPKVVILVWKQGIDVLVFKTYEILILKTLYIYSCRIEDYDQPYMGMF